MSIASRATRIGLPAALLLLASGMLLACGATGEVGSVVGPQPDGGVLPEAGAPPPSGNLLSIQCGPFGPSRISRSANAQSDPQVAVADFNCDGHPDAVTATSYYDDGAHGSLRLRLGNGDGTFRDGGAISLGVDAAPVGMIAGDFNGDGAPDFVVAVTRGSNQNALLYYRGSCGAEAWSPKVLEDPSPYLGTGMAVADMNGDGYKDLVLARATWPNRIDVLLGAGVPFEHLVKSDAFSDATPEGRIRAFAVGDFDGDGRPDAAAVTGKGLDVLLGNGTGRLTRAAGLAGAGWFAVKAADLDNNGRDDIVTMRRALLSPTVVDAYDYNSESGIVAGRTLLTMPGAAQLAAADLDGDGRADLVVSGASTRNWPSALLFGSGAKLALPSTIGALGLADVTGDGRTDLVFDGSYGLEVYPHLPRCRLSTPTCSSGAAYTRTRYPLAKTPLALLFGDLHGTGDQDVIAVGNDNISILVNVGDGTLALGPDVPIKATGVAVGNFDGANADKIIAVDGSRGWTVIRGDGYVRVVRPDGFPNVTNVVAGDFNGDLKDDLAFKSSKGLEVLPRGDPALRFHVDVRAFLLRAVDFNADGRTDLLLAPYGSGGLCVMYGPLTPQSTCQDIAGAPRLFSGLGDLDGDGRPDLTSAGPGATIDLWSHNGAENQLLVPEYGWLGAHVLSSATGPASLLVRAKGDALAVYAGNGDGTLGPGGPTSVQQSPGPIAFVVTHDLDADGTDEILDVTRGPNPALWVMHRCPTSSVIR